MAEVEQENRASGRQWQQTKRTRASIWQPRPTLACLCVCVCVCPIYGHQTVAMPSPLNPLDFFFLLLFSCAIHLRACKIRDAPTNLVGEGGGMFWLCSNSSRSSHHRHPNNSHLFNTPTHPTTSLRCSTAYIG